MRSLSTAGPTKLEVLAPEDLLVEKHGARTVRHGSRRGSTGRTAVVATNGGTNNPISCPQVSTLQLRLIDADSWSWGPDIALEAAPWRADFAPTGQGPPRSRQLGVTTAL